MLQLDVELEAIERVVIKIEQANNDTAYEPSTGRRFLLLPFPDTLCPRVDASASVAKRHQRSSLLWSVLKLFLINQPSKFLVIFTQKKFISATYTRCVDNFCSAWIHYSRIYKKSSCRWNG